MLVNYIKVYEPQGLRTISFKCDYDYLPTDIIERIKTHLKSGKYELIEYE